MLQDARKAFCCNYFMKDKTLKIIKISTMFVLAFTFLFTALYSYSDSWEYLYELTFLSNFLTGLFLLIAGILSFLNKSVPQFMFLDFTVLLLIVFGVCVSFITEFNFENGFLYLHIVNPLLMLVFFLFGSDQSRVKRQQLFTVLAMPFVYLIFASIFGAATGNYIYFFLNYTEYGIGNTLLFIFGILIGIIVVSAGLCCLNKLIHKHIKKYI